MSNRHIETFLDVLSDAIRRPAWLPKIFKAPLCLRLSRSTHADRAVQRADGGMKVAKAAPVLFSVVCWIGIPVLGVIKVVQATVSAALSNDVGEGVSYLLLGLIAAMLAWYMSSDARISRHAAALKPRVQDLRRLLGSSKPLRWCAVPVQAGGIYMLGCLMTPSVVNAFAGLYTLAATLLVLYGLMWPLRKS